MNNKSVKYQWHKEVWQQITCLLVSMWLPGRGRRCRHTGRCSLLGALSRHGPESMCFWREWESVSVKSAPCWGSLRKDWIEDFHHLYKVLWEHSGMTEHFCMDLVWNRHHSKHVLCSQILKKFSKLKKTIAVEDLMKDRRAFTVWNQYVETREGCMMENSFQPHFLNAHVGNVAKEFGAWEVNR